MILPSMTFLYSLLYVTTRSLSTICNRSKARWCRLVLFISSLKLTISLRLISLFLIHAQFLLSLSLSLSQTLCKVYAISSLFIFIFFLSLEFSEVTTPPFICTLLFKSFYTCQVPPRLAVTSCHRGFI